MNDESTKDAAGIGVSAETRSTLEELASMHFITIGSAFKACVALAIAMDWEVDFPKRVERTWQTGGAFADVLDLVSWRFKTDRPAKLVEALGYTALLHIKEQVESGASFSKIFVEQIPSSKK
jgi:hypothetical protein